MVFFVTIVPDLSRIQWIIRLGFRKPGGYDKPDISDSQSAEELGNLDAPSQRH
jgi:hypothetical protein